MTYITLSEEQSRVIEQARGPVEIRDSRGRAVAQVRPLSSEDLAMIAQARRNKAAGGTPVAGAQVQAHLRRLEEIAKTEQLDEAKARDLLQRMRAGKRYEPLYRGLVARGGGRPRGNLAGAKDRAAVTKSQADADHLLARDPYGSGRFVSEELYQIDCPPLAISYTVDDGKRVVEVQAVREIVS